MPGCKTKKVISHPFSFVYQTCPSIETLLFIICPILFSEHHTQFTKSTCSMYLGPLGPAYSNSYFLFSFLRLPGQVTTYEIMSPLFRPFCERSRDKARSKVKPVWHIPNFPHLHIVNIVLIPLMSMKQILRALSLPCILY